MAVDYFLKLDGVKGESKKDGHKDEIDVLSWNWGESQTGTSAEGGGGGAGKVSMNDFTFSMRTSKASSKLLLFCANGKHIPSGLLTCRKAGEKQQEYLKIKFSDLLVSSFHTGGHEGQEIPVDSISLNFSKIEYEYKEQDAKGNLGGAIKAHWDLKTGKGGE